MFRRSAVAVVVCAFLSGCSGGGGGGGEDDRCANVTCTALDACHVAGVCSASTGLCSNPSAGDGTPCTGGTCQSGTCQPTGDLCAGVICEPLDACHPAGSCDPASGACVSAPAADGTSCAGGAGSCSAGACVSAGGTCEDGARNGGETDVDCGGPLCAPCVLGRACGGPADCLGGACTGGVCKPVVAALVADPGRAWTLHGGERVVLDGTRSRSPRGPITSWAWTQAGGPAVVLTGTNTARPAFDAPAAPAEPLVFTLTVGDGTATASASVTLTVQPGDAPAPETTLGLLLQDLRTGALDRDTAMTYLAYSTTGDPRLPPAYAGTLAAPSLSAAKHILVQEFPTLSPAAQALIAPFLLPPAAPGSAESLADQAPALRALGAGSAWVGVSSAHAVIWYRQSLANGAATATALSREFETVIWPKHRQLWGEDHLPVLNDAGIKLVNGGTHGKLNVYLTTKLPNGASGDESAYGTAPAPSFIRLEQTMPFRGSASQFGLCEVLAHESTHSCQDSYPQSEPYEGHRWIFEGVATWAQDYVYPDTNTEHAQAAQWLRHPQDGLTWDADLRPYGTYLFFQYVTRAGGDDDFIRRAFEEFQTKPAAEAVDAALVPPGQHEELGFNIYWAAFTAAGWNRDPAQSFWANDGLERGARPVDNVYTNVTMTGPETTYEASPFLVNDLTAHYYYFKLPDPTARQIYFYDGLTYKLAWKTTQQNKQLTVADGWEPDPDRQGWVVSRLLTKQDDAWTTVMPPAPGGMVVCQDDPAEKIDELVVLFGNSSPKPSTLWIEGERPRILASNIGCYRWQGTISAVTSPNWRGPQETISATVTWGRETMFDQAGQAIFSPVQVTADWSVSGDFDGCSYSGVGGYGGAGFQAGMMVFAPTVTEGPMHRGYTAQGMPFLVSYVKTCPSGSNIVQGHVPWIDTQKFGDPDWNPVVDGSGMQASGSVDDGHYVWTWSFTSTPGN
ncbi:MAG: hypothetical protein QM767_20935 [Anaeromyxobacter sp.]